MTPAAAGPLVIDTHAAVWYLQQDARLSKRAEAEIDRALADGYPIYLPSISVVELIYLIEKGKIPAAVANGVGARFAGPGIRFQARGLGPDGCRCNTADPAPRGPRLA
jgi:PIN domain nuclease of toxin-antitoxin system